MTMRSQLSRISYVAISLAVVASALSTEPAAAATPAFYTETSFTQMQTDINSAAAAGDSPITITLGGIIPDPRTGLVLPSGSNVVLDLHGYGFTITGDPMNPAGIQTTGATLTINDNSDPSHTGTLTATGYGSGGLNGAGIGGGRDGAGGTLTINGGTIVASVPSFADDAAGIGGSRGTLSGAGGVITITGGDVTATGGSASAGIGGAFRAAGGNITITGGAVTATGARQAAGIGGGANGTGGTISISGGTVTATAGGNGGSPTCGGAGIGGGDGGSAGTISLTSGNSSPTQVNATAGAGAGIGSGALGGCLSGPTGGSVSIGSGVTVIANSNQGGSAVGGGYGATAPTVTNSGNLTLEGSQTTPATASDFTNTSTGMIDLKTALTGGGYLANAGTLLLDTGGSITAGTTVTEHNYPITFDVSHGPGGQPAPLMVYAATVAAANQTLPAPVAGYLWSTTPTGNDPVTDTSDLHSLVGWSATGPTPVTLYENPIITLSPAGGADSTSPVALTGGTVGGAYSLAFTANRGLGPYTFASGGTVPPGLTLNGGSGALAGTPTTPGTYTFSITATDGDGVSSKPEWYTINVPSPITIAPATLPDATVGESYSQQISATGDPDASWQIQPYNFSLDSGALPPTLTLSSSGLVSGIANSTGSFTFTVKASGEEVTGCPPPVVAPCPTPDGDTNTTTYTIKVVASTAATSRDPIAFGNTAINTMGTTKASVTLDPGFDHLQVGAQTGPFAVALGACSAGSCPVTITYSPTKVGTDTGTTVLSECNSAGCLPLTNSPLNESGSGVSVFGISPPTADLGNVPLNTWSPSSPPQTITVDAGYTFDPAFTEVSSTLQGPWSTGSANTCTQAIGSPTAVTSCILVSTAMPTTLGSQSLVEQGQECLIANPASCIPLPAPLTTTLTGVSVLTASPSPLDFGAIQTGTSATKPLTITPDAGTVLTSVTSDNAVISTKDTCPAGATTCTLHWTAAPTTTGTFIGTITLHECGAPRLLFSALPTTCVTKTVPFTGKSTTALPAKVIVSFNAEGGSPTPGSVTVAADTAPFANGTGPSNPARANYVFDGWSTTPTGGALFNVGKETVSTDTTLYAHWTGVPETLAFDTASGKPSTVTVPYGSTVAPPARPLKKGYSFQGWFTSPSGGAKFDFSKPVTGNSHLYAHWMSNPKVRALVSVNPSTVTQGGKITITGTGFKPDEKVSAMIHTKPDNLGLHTVNAHGSITFTATVPRTFPPGSHTVILTGQSSKRTAHAGLTVTVKTSKPRYPTQAATGYGDSPTPTPAPSDRGEGTAPGTAILAVTEDDRRSHHRYGEL